MKKIILSIIVLSTLSTWAWVKTKEEDEAELEGKRLAYHQRVVMAKDIMTLIHNGQAKDKDRENLLLMLAIERYGEP